MLLSNDEYSKTWFCFLDCSSWYWFVHIVVFLIVLVLPGGSQKPKKVADKKAEEEQKDK